MRSVDRPKYFLVHSFLRGFDVFEAKKSLYLVSINHMFIGFPIISSGPRLQEEEEDGQQSHFLLRRGTKQQTLVLLILVTGR